MARQKKSGTYLNIYLEQTLSDTLDKYCAQTDRTKTSVVERALRRYFEMYADEIEGAENTEIVTRL